MQQSTRDALQQSSRSLGQLASRPATYSMDTSVSVVESITLPPASLLFLLPATLRLLLRLPAAAAVLRCPILRCLRMGAVARAVGPIQCCGCGLLLCWLLCVLLLRFWLLRHLQCKSRSLMATISRQKRTA